ncbi:MAG: protein-disulfide reductase DsbD [Rhodoferax sp.]|nr:protein-disulfide reductase DsbD [Rhodoferax sp.]
MPLSERQSVVIISSFQAGLQRLLVMTFVMAMGLWSGFGHAETTFLAADQAFVFKVVQPAQPGEPVVLRWTIAPGYYLYRDRLEVTAKPSGAELAVDRPAGETKTDPAFGPVEVYHGQLVVPVRSEAAKSLHVTWQGCAEAGLCYPPQTREIALSAMSGPSLAGPSGKASGEVLPGSWSQMSSSNDGAIQSLLQSHSLLWAIPIFFALGIALAFTPCVLPMVPILSSIVVGRGAAPRRALALSLAFVVPMAVTYAGLGVVAALAGANLQAMLQNRWALYGLEAVFVVLAASMFGFFTLQLPRQVRNRLDDASRQQKGGTLLGACAMGFLSALLVGPCMTAPLAGTLLYIAQSGNAIHGGVLLLSLGLGMGLPLLMIATVGSKYLPAPGPWMDRVKGAFGFLLLATAVWMVQRVVAPSMALALWGALLVALSVALFQLGRDRVRPSAGAGQGLSVVAPAIAVLVGLWGGAMWLGAAAGAADPWQPLAFLAGNRGTGNETIQTGARMPRFQSVDSAQALTSQIDAARAAGKPVLLDFYADWCVSCKSIEAEVFGDPKVARALEGAVLLRADVTASTPEQLALMRRYQVIGPPTVMLFDAQGQERRGARLVGEFDSNDLIKRLPVSGEVSS